MVVKADYERIKTLLKDTITLLCRNGLSFKTEFSVEALIGITLDKEDVFLVSINEIIRSELGTQLAMAKAAEERTMAAKEEDGNSSDLQPATPSSTNGHHYRKRKHSVEHASPQEPAEDGQESESGDDDERGLENADLLIDDSNSEPASKKTVSDLSMPTTQTKNDDTNDIVYIKEEIDTGDWPGDSQAEESFSDMSIPPASSSNQQHNDNFDFLQGSSLVPVSSDSSGRQSWPEVMPSQSTSSNMNVSLSKRTSTLTGSEPSTQGEHSQQVSANIVCKSEDHEEVEYFPETKHSPDPLFCPPPRGEIKSENWHQKTSLPSTTSAEGALDALTRENALVAERPVARSSMLSIPVTDPAQAGRPCPFCQKILTSPRGYKLHIDAHKGIFPHTCSYCKRGFLSKTGLEGHLVQHTNKKMYMCFFCGKEFKYKHGLHYHHHVCPERKK